MNSISDLRELFLGNGMTNVYSQGWFLEYFGDRWTMLDGDYYLNGVKVARKDILEYAKNPPKKKSSTKMMRAKDYFNQEEVCDDSESVEVDNK